MSWDEPWGATAGDLQPIRHGQSDDRRWFVIKDLLEDQSPEYVAQQKYYALVNFLKGILVCK